MRCNGFSSTGMAMLLLVLGCLILTGLNQQLHSSFSAVGGERAAIHAFVQATSALNRAMQQRWQPEANWLCRDVDNHSRVCIKRTTSGRALFSVQSGQGKDIVRLWQSVSVENENHVMSLRPLPGGWSDFCPFREVSQCSIP